MGSNMGKDSHSKGPPQGKGKESAQGRLGDGKGADGKGPLDGNHPGLRDGKGADGKGSDGPKGGKGLQIIGRSKCLLQHGGSGGAYSNAFTCNSGGEVLRTICPSCPFVDEYYMYRNLDGMFLGLCMKDRLYVILILKMTSGLLWLPIQLEGIDYITKGSGKGLMLPTTLPNQQPQWWLAAGTQPPATAAPSAAEPSAPATEPATAPLVSPKAKATPMPYLSLQRFQQ